MINLFGSQVGFVSPLLFYSAAVIGSLLLVYAYLRKGRAKRIRVASTMILHLLKNIPKARQKFIPPWRFFLELLLLLLLAGAAGGLYIQDYGNKYALLLDNSASMSAPTSLAGDRKTLFDVSVEWLEKEISETPWGSEFNLYIISPVLTSFSKGYVNKEQAISLLRTLQVSNYRDNLQFALDEILKEESWHSLFAASDSNLSKKSDSESREIKWLNSRTFSQLRQYDNLAVHDIRLTESPLSKNRQSLEVVIQAYSKQETSAKVRLSACESFNTCNLPKLISEKNTAIAQQGSVQLTFDDLPLSTFAYFIELRDIKGDSSQLADSLQIDNSAWITASSPQTKVLLVSELSPSALGLNLIPTLNIDAVPPRNYGSFISNLDISKYSSVIFHRYVPDLLPDSNLVFVLPPANKIFGVGQTLKNVEVSRWKEGHPLLSYLNIAALKFNVLNPLSKPAVTEELITTPSGTAAFAGELNRKRIAVYGFELFPFEGRRSPLLSVLTLNTMKWVSEISSEVGFQRMETPLPINSEIRSMVLHNGRNIYLSNDNDELQRLYVDQPGLLRIDFHNKDSTHRAFRFFISEESNLNDIRDIELGESLKSEKPMQRSDSTMAAVLIKIILLILLIDIIIQLLVMILRVRRYRYAGGH